ncbi:MAG: hypothetical protein KGK16_05005, partial [Bradyrhizobium sp.]|nr:hypothetical protein [Bradyrhizobium sp.]
SPAALEAAMAVFRPGLYDAALGRRPGGTGLAASGLADNALADSALADSALGELGPVDAFAGPRFDPRDLEGYLTSLAIPPRQHA